MFVHDESGQNHRPVRRLRIDGSASPRRATRPGTSGRPFVLAIGSVLLLVTVILSFAFRDWRTRYRARAAFGATQVAPAVEPLTHFTPDGVDPSTWAQAVLDTRRTIIAVTAANVLSLDQMHALRNDVIRHVSRAQPDTAVRELAGLWDDLKLRSGPALNPSRHPRPNLLMPHQ